MSRKLIDPNSVSPTNSPTAPDPPTAVNDPDPDSDEVIAEYDVFITPSLADQVYLLQFPNRAEKHPYNKSHLSCPLAMRLKPHTGFLELDLGMNPRANFNRAKGVEWGRSLQEAQQGNANAFGIAAGFGKGGRTGQVEAANRAQLNAGVDEDERTAAVLESWDDAVDTGKVMTRQTLGGQIVPPEADRPVYMMGAFRGSGCPL
jgi:DNA-directed RNA polymerase-3 subunit RPC5